MLLKKSCELLLFKTQTKQINSIGKEKVFNLAPKLELGNGQGYTLFADYQLIATGCVRPDRRMPLLLLWTGDAYRGAQNRCARAISRIEHVTASGV
jgi:hypothetical protein